MKNRFGFVSNSSSSSFVVSVPKGADATFTVSVKRPLNEYAVELKTLREVEEFFLSDFEYYKDITTIEDAIEKDKSIGPKYKLMKKEIKAGRHVFVGGFCNEECDPISDFLYENGSISSDKIMHNFNILIDE